MKKSFNPNEILSKFNISSEIKEFGNGHINDTYCTESPKYILQRINTEIFKKPEELMANIENVTSFLKKKIQDNSGNPERETLTVIKTADGKNYYKYNDNNAFRVYKFIDDTKTIEFNASLTELESFGKAFGRFQKMLDEYPVENLYETIKDFHNTPERVAALKKAIKDDACKRVSSVKEEIEFALEGEKYADTVIKAIESKNVPVRVSHNDTKINNVLFDMKTNEAVCVIDLDTVMPGSMLYDFGDALRVAGSTASEDETELDKVMFRKDAFESFALGYLSEMKNFLTETEIELLPFSVKLMTYECGIRFLTDYINGDTYFKIHRENHNLDRARNQFKLVREISQIEDELKKIIKGMIE